MRIERRLHRLRNRVGFQYLRVKGFGCSITVTRALPSCAFVLHLIGWGVKLVRASDIELHLSSAPLNGYDCGMYVAASQHGQAEQWVEQATPSDGGW